MQFLRDIALTLLSTTLFLTVGFLFFSFIGYLYESYIAHKGEEMKLAQIEAIYERWFSDIDYTSKQFLADVGKILEEGNE